MNDLKRILKSWAVSAILTKWLMTAAVIGGGYVVITGQGLHVEISINKEVE